MHDHTTLNDNPHPRTVRSALHMVGAIADFWSSGLNRAAVDLINPQPAMTLLDVGAGLGPATFEAAGRIGPDGRMIAVDPSAAMRRALRVRRLWQRNRRLIDIRHGGAEELPVSTRSVDAAWAVNATHHFSDLSRAAAEFARVLKPGGRLLIIEENFTNPTHPYYHHQSEAHGPEPVDAAHIAALLIAADLTVTYTENQAISDVTATVINATAPTTVPHRGEQQ